MLVLIFAFRLSDAAERNTLTVDEPHYVGVGLHLWQSGDYHLRVLPGTNLQQGFHQSKLFQIHNL